MTRVRLSTTAVATMVLAAGLTVPASAGLAADFTQVRGGDASDRLELRTESSGVAAVEEPLVAPRGAARRMSGAAQSLGVWESEPFSQVAVTWTGVAGDFEVRTRTEGSWSGWQELEPLGDGPDGPEVATRQGSDLLWVRSADAVQVRVTGRTPTDLRLVLQRPGAVAASTSGGGDPVGTTHAPGGTAASVVGVADGTTADDATDTPSATAPEVEPTSTTKRTKVPRPTALNKRREWNPNKKWLNGKATYNSDLKQVHIHHTASSNDYTQADVPGIIRGMQRYHTQSLGWFDLGYNFLVDKYGGMWVGRKGGAGKKVRGAHTLGFNHDSTGIAVIGNYESAAPSKRMLGKIARIAAWKLDRHNAPKAKGKVKVTSTGSDRYRAGTTVKLPAIDGHRDTNQTACPGAELYELLPKIRRKAQRRLDKFRS